MGTDVQKRKARIPLGGERRRGGLEDTYGGASLGRERRSETLDYGLGTSHTIAGTTARQAESGTSLLLFVFY